MWGGVCVLFGINVCIDLLGIGGTTQKNKEGTDVDRHWERKNYSTVFK